MGSRALGANGRAVMRGGGESRADDPRLMILAALWRSSREDRGGGSDARGGAWMSMASRVWEVEEAMGE
jgi:hypothetical protein